MGQPTVERPPHAVECAKRGVDAVLEVAGGHNFVGCSQVAQVVGVVVFRFSVVFKFSSPLA